MSRDGAGNQAGESDDEADIQADLYACRCLSNLMEVLPGSVAVIVHAGAVPVLCKKLQSIQFIELGAQVISVSLFRTFGVCIPCSNPCFSILIRPWKRLQESNLLLLCVPVECRPCWSFWTFSTNTISVPRSQRFPTAARGSHQTTSIMSKPSSANFETSWLFPSKKWWRLLVFPSFGS